MSTHAVVTLSSLSLCLRLRRSVNFHGRCAAAFPQAAATAQWKAKIEAWQMRRHGHWAMRGLGDNRRRQAELRARAGGKNAEAARMRPVAAFLARLRLSEYQVAAE